MTKSMKVFVVIVVALLAVAAGFYLIDPGAYRREYQKPSILAGEAKRGAQQKEDLAAAAQEENASSLTKDIDAWGNPQAPVTVEGFIPDSACHGDVVKMVIDLAKAHPDDVHLVMYRMFSPTGQKRMKQRNRTCAGFEINGTDQVTITTPDGKQKQVLFQKSPEMGNYEPPELKLAIEQAITKAKKTA